MGAVGDLLDVTRIRTGTLPVDPQLADLAVLLDQARKAAFGSGAQWPAKIFRV